MIYFFNRGLILEQEIVEALKKYFSILGVPDYYKNYTITVTNQHPFARMLLSETPDKDAVNLFPVVVVATEDDSKPSELSALTDGADSITFTPEDMAEPEGGGKSYIEKRYDMITPQIMAKLREDMNAKKDKCLNGMSMFIRRRDQISIEIWAENPQLKNELYEIIRLFVCGFMRDYLADLYKQYFEELKDGQSPLVIFDSSVKGQRGNNFNIDFGIELYGAHITFDADYIIEQTVIDTEIVDTNNLLLEVLNHVKDCEYAARERIALGDESVPGTDGGAGDGSAEPDPEAEEQGE